jgi:cell division protein FtsW (lipid II flippase)
MKKLAGNMGYSSIVSMLALGLMVLSSPYRIERVSAFLDPWEKQDGAQPLVQALAKIGDPKR